MGKPFEPNDDDAQTRREPERDEPPPPKVEWRLSKSDQRLLRALRINPEA